MLFYALGMFLMPIVMLVDGWRMWKKESGAPGVGAGVRSPRSLKSRAAWGFSRRYAGERIFVLGLIGLAVSALSVWLLRNSEWMGAATGILILLYLGLHLLVTKATERAINARFDEEGNPRPDEVSPKAK